MLRKLVSLCTLDLVNLMQLVDETHPMDLEDKADDLEYEMEAITEDNLQPMRERIAKAKRLAEGLQKLAAITDASITSAAP